MSGKRPVRRSERRRRRQQAEVAGTVQPPRPGETERDYEQRTKRRGPGAEKWRGPNYTILGDGVWFDEAVPWDEEKYQQARQYLDERLTGPGWTHFITFDPARPDAEIRVLRLPSDVERACSDWADEGHSTPVADIEAALKDWRRGEPPAYLERVFGDWLARLGIGGEPAQEGGQGDAGGREGDAQTPDAAGGGTDNRSGPDDPIQ